MQRKWIRDFFRSFNAGPLQKPVSIGLLLIWAIGLLAYFFIQDSRGSDWLVYFRPAARDLLELKNVYASSPYPIPYPIWSLFPAIPFALLPNQIGYALLAFSTLFVMGLVALKRGAKPVSLALFVFMPQVLFMAGNGNYFEAFAAMGLILPPQIGLFFVLAKPQIGAAVAIFWLAEAWRDGGFRQAIRIFGPVTAAYVLMFLLYSPDIFTEITEWSNTFGASQAHDANIWPYGAVLGLALLTYAIRKREFGPAILSSVCFAPYVGFYSWPIALLGLLPAKWEFGIAVLAMSIIGFLTL
ncbi:MAG: hypothetical protein ACRDFQ_09215 [Anaerolineales bacterium]